MGESSHRVFVCVHAVAPIHCRSVKDETTVACYWWCDCGTFTVLLVSSRCVISSEGGSHPRVAVQQADRQAGPWQCLAQHSTTQHRIAACQAGSSSLQEEAAGVIGNIMMVQLLSLTSPAGLSSSVGG